MPLVRAGNGGWIGGGRSANPGPLRSLPRPPVATLRGWPIGRTPAGPGRRGAWSRHSSTGGRCREHPGGPCPVSTTRGPRGSVRAIEPFFYRAGLARRSPNLAGPAFGAGLLAEAWRRLPDRGRRHWSRRGSADRRWRRRTGRRYRAGRSGSSPTRCRRRSRRPGRGRRQGQEDSSFDPARPGLRRSRLASCGSGIQRIGR